jgi:ferredoxin
MRFANRALSVGGLLLAVTGLASCGSGGTLLSADQANELKGQLAQVAQSISARQCQQAANQITNFRSTVDGLNSVDQSLVANLDQGASRLSQLAARQCPVQAVHHTATINTTPATTTQTTTTTTTAPTTTTQTATTQTTPTQTTPTSTTTGPGTGGVGLPGGDGNGNGKAKDKGPGSGGGRP